MSSTPRPTREGPGWGSVATVLRAGTIIAVAAIGLGLAWALLVESEAPTDLTVVELIVAGGPDAVVAVGLLALTLVPIAALGAAGLVFARSGERRALVLTVVVVLLLLSSLVAAAVIGATA